MAVVGELAVVQVALEDNQVRLGQVKEQIGSLRVQVPESEALPNTI